MPTSSRLPWSLTLTLALAPALAACGGGAAAPASSSSLANHDPATPDDGDAHAPCYPDRATVPVRELYDAALAGTPGACQIVERLADNHGEGPAEPVRVIVDGEHEIAALDYCGLTVSAPGVTDARGVMVGDDVDAVAAAYPLASVHYIAGAGLGGEASLALFEDELDLASFELDGMGPAGYPEDEEALDAVRGQHVASYTVSFACD
ncbi:MAG: hypothetical protein KC464_08885 [Myxococcales bacterium]|nr:hypothetical protein [Myxococcales bacterium]